MDALLRNVAHGLRLLRKQPTFTATAVTVLALGIGANSAMFSLVNTLLFKPLVIADPSTLVGVFSRAVEKPDAFRAFSYSEFAELRDHNRAFTSLAAHNLSLVGLGEGEATRRLFADSVSASWFATFGAPLHRGRTFSAAEDRPGSGVPVAIVSYSFWKRRGSDPDMLGSTLHINGNPFTVVGIAGKGFTGSTALVSPELYLPLGMYGAVMNDFDGARPSLLDPTNASLLLVGRLRPGVTRTEGDARLAEATARMARSGVPGGAQVLVARPLSRMGISTQPQSDDGLRLPALLLLFLSGIVLLVASLNIANMMLVRGASRRREIAVRLALGARRRTLLAQLLTEGLLLALLGGVAGLAVSYGSTTVLVRSLAGIAPLDLVVSAAPDVRVLAATAAFCLLATVLFALGPAWNLSRPEVAGDLKAGLQESSKRGRPLRLSARRNLLVVGQLGLSLMLLSTAGLFIRSSLRAARLAPGFAVDDEVIVEVDPGLAGYDREQSRAALARLVDHFATGPGVESASLAATVPFGMVSLGRDVQRASDPAGDSAGPSEREGVVPCSYNIVSEDYFATLRIPVLHGRPFLPAETSAGTATVAILDRLAANALWPHENAVGQSLRLVATENREAKIVTVVGVVGSVQEHLVGTQQSPHVYLPFGPELQTNVNLHLRVAGGSTAAARLLGGIRREVAAVDPNIPVLSARTLRRHLDAAFDVWLMRTASRLFAAFGGLALLLAGVGLYGVRAFAVARRTREIGIRMAVGASARDAVRLILREGIVLTSIGAAAGLALSLVLGRAVASMLYGVSGSDPLVLGVALAVLAAVSMLACYVPARRAAQIAPMVGLRDE